MTYELFPCASVLSGPRQTSLVHSRHLSTTTYIQPSRRPLLLHDRLPCHLPRRTPRPTRAGAVRLAARFLLRRSVHRVLARQPGGSSAVHGVSGAREQGTGGGRSKVIGLFTSLHLLLFRAGEAHNGTRASRVGESMRLYLVTPTAAHLLQPAVHPPTPLPPAAHPQTGCTAAQDST